MSRFRCYACPDQAWVPGGVDDFLRHHAASHGHLAVDVPNLNDAKTKAIAEARRLAALGQPFQLWQCFIGGDLPNHKAAAGAFAAELEHMGVCHVVGYAPSNRPDTKSSAVAVWRGGPKPTAREASAA